MARGTFEYDSKNAAHRILSVAVEQAMEGKGLIACGSAVKAVEAALQRQDWESIVLASGFMCDDLGLLLCPKSIAYWRTAAPQFTTIPWLNTDIQQRWQTRLQLQATQAESIFFGP